MAAPKCRSTRKLPTIHELSPIALGWLSLSVCRGDWPAPAGARLQPTRPASEIQSPSSLRREDHTVRPQKASGLDLVWLVAAQKIRLRFFPATGRPRPVSRFRRQFWIGSEDLQFSQARRYQHWISLRWQSSERAALPITPRAALLLSGPGSPERPREIRKADLALAAILELEELSEPAGGPQLADSGCSSDQRVSRAASARAARRSSRAAAGSPAASRGSRDCRHQTR